MQCQTAGTNGRKGHIMKATVQVTFDCTDPHRLARFWAEALGYEKESHATFVEGLLSGGTIDRDATLEVDGGVQFADVSACQDPDGLGPRLFFQKVPEGKARKNRLHLDLHVGPECFEVETQRLEDIGARKLWFSDDRGASCWTMAEPEGNEFCVD
jgi:hypothetical protein